MKNIALVGAGNIGSRHLQALKSVNFKLKIHVIDPNQISLKLAKERYESVPSNQYKHEIHFNNKIKKFEEKIDLAIIATNSDVRRSVIEELLMHNNVNYLLLEKILFQKPEDYFIIKDLFESNNCNAWVNCTRRISQYYQTKLKNWFNQEKIFFSVIGANWGLISNIIHFIDYMVYLTECNNLIIDTSHLDPLLIPTKRKGFLEITGILQAHLENGSHGIFTCYSSGKGPFTVHISSNNINCFFEQDAGKAWVYDGRTESEWKKFDLRLLNTSQLTKNITEEIIENHRCSLPTYNESMKIHLAVFNPILEFLNKISPKKYSYYPFT